MPDADMWACARRVPQEGVLHFSVADRDRFFLFFGPFRHRLMLFRSIC